MKKLLIFLFVFSILLLQVSAQTNSSIESQADSCLNESRAIVNELMNDGFSYQRVNDSLKQFENIYDAQKILKLRNANYDFSKSLIYCEEMKQIRDLAYSSRDELNALDKFYNESVAGLNTSSIDYIINQANLEMKNERYEKIDELVNNAYSEISNARASQTTLNIFYSATARGLKSFFNKYWKFLISLLVLFIIIFIVYKKAIASYLINRKIKKLELRKETIKKIIMDTQKTYFQDGGISESEFTIKTKKLAELIRDIERQIPLLKEELAKLNKSIDHKNE